jgi:hypothetical protein
LEDEDPRLPKGIPIPPNGDDGARWRLEAEPDRLNRRANRAGLNEEIAGWHLSKPAAPGAEDAWLVNEMYVEINDQLLYFDAVFSDQGPMTAGTGQRSGNWTGTQAFKGQCGG